MNERRGRGEGVSEGTARRKEGKARRELTSSEGCSLTDSVILLIRSEWQSEERVSGRQRKGGGLWGQSNSFSFEAIEDPR